jgi:hypothetical protein
VTKTDVFEISYVRQVVACALLNHRLWEGDRSRLQVRAVSIYFARHGYLWTASLEEMFVVTGEPGDHFHRHHRGPGGHPMISAHTSPPQVGELPPEEPPDESFILPVRPLRRWREDSTSAPFMASDQGMRVRSRRLSEIASAAE